MSHGNAGGHPREADKPDTCHSCVSPVRERSQCSHWPWGGGGRVATCGKGQALRRGSGQASCAAGGRVRWFSIVQRRPDEILHCNRGWVRSGGGLERLASVWKDRLLTSSREREDADRAGRRANFGPVGQSAGWRDHLRSRTCPDSVAAAHRYRLSEPAQMAPGAPALHHRADRNPADPRRPPRHPGQELRGKDRAAGSQSRHRMDQHRPAAAVLRTDPRAEGAGGPGRAAAGPLRPGPDTGHASGVHPVACRPDQLRQRPRE